MLPMPINVSEKLSKFDDQWSPKTIAQMDGFHFKLAKVQGDFVWHSHSNTDEAFFVLDGRLRIDFRDGSVTLNQGEMLVIPKGVDHKPFAESECQLMLFVRSGTLNTGDATESERTSDPTAEI
jgi:mannose-6-phosphate isomerase-like protein (cupin superfamily)